MVAAEAAMYSKRPQKLRRQTPRQHRPSPGGDRTGVEAKLKDPTRSAVPARGLRNGDRSSPGPDSPWCGMAVRLDDPTEEAPNSLVEAARSAATLRPMCTGGEAGACGRGGRMPPPQVAAGSGLCGALDLGFAPRLRRCVSVDVPFLARGDHLLALRRRQQTVKIAVFVPAPTMWRGISRHRSPYALVPPRCQRPYPPKMHPNGPRTFSCGAVR
jgi:hypothetical protein